MKESKSFNFVEVYESRMRRAYLLQGYPDNNQFKHLTNWLAVNKKRYEQSLKEQQ